MDTQNLQTEIQWPLYERNFLKIFLLIEEFSDDSALVEASGSKHDEALFFFLISNKELTCSHQSHTLHSTLKAFFTYIS